MEDQGVNGDIWNKQATELLTRLGWKNIGDHDIDIKGGDKDKYGIDTLMTYVTPLKNRPQSVILEAKRYVTNSFQAGHLQAWIKRLDEKLVALRDSSNLFELFPELVLGEYSPELPLREELYYLSCFQSLKIVQLLM